MTSLTAVIVSRGLEALLHVCLEHLQRALARVPASVAHRVVVVDDATPFPLDGRALRARGAELVRFDVHRSFARACNAGAARHAGDGVLLLNNDVLLAPDALTGMLAALEAVPRAGVCGARLLFPDASVQHCGVVFGAGARGPYHVHRGRPGHAVARSVAEFQAVTGACLLARREVWDALGGLDEDYPFGLEDVDFCLRARQQGWRVVCAGDTDSLHFESSTPGRAERDVSSRALFMRRWHGRYTLDG